MQEIVESSKARRKMAAEAIEILTDAYQSPAYSEKTMDRIAEMKGIVSCLQAPFIFFSRVKIVLFWLYQNVWLQRRDHPNVDRSIYTNCKLITRANSVSEVLPLAHEKVVSFTRPSKCNFGNLFLLWYNMYI